nr:DegV family protein [Lachnospiraceae bacterium]
MAVRILTDSASDISQARAKEWGITVIPLRVRFGDEEFLDGVTLSCKDFY